MQTPETPHDILDALSIEHNTESTPIVDPLENFWEDIQHHIESIEPENPVVAETKTLPQWVKNCIFGFKYICTSGFIFLVLLITTNYSAYFGLLKSYIYADELSHQWELLVHSVAASNIQEEIIEEKEIQTQATQAASRDPHAIDQILNIKKQDELKLDIEIVPYENRVIIPKIAKNIPLLDIKNQKIGDMTELNKIFMKELENGVIRYPGSAKPGQDGNAFIFGHSSNFPWMDGDYNDVFSLLDHVEFNDEIIVYYGQKKHTYKITTKQVIAPGDVSVLEWKDDLSEITLMTCWPIGTTLNRLIVTGTLVE